MCYRRGLLPVPLDVVGTWKPVYHCTRVKVSSRWLECLNRRITFRSRQIYRLAGYSVSIIDTTRQIVLLCKIYIAGLWNLDLFRRKRNDCISIAPMTIIRSRIVAMRKDRFARVGTNSPVKGRGIVVRRKYMVAMGRNTAVTISRNQIVAMRVAMRKDRFARVGTNRPVRGRVFVVGRKYLVVIGRNTAVTIIRSQIVAMRKDRFARVGTNRPVRGRVIVLKRK